MKPILLRTSALAIGLMLAQTALAQTAPAAVLDTYADIAAAKYADSLTTARTLQAAVAALIANPSDATLTAARTA